MLAAAMNKTPQELALQVAFDDPRLAYMLLTRRGMRKDFQMVFDFAQGQKGTLVGSQTFTKRGCDYFVYDLVYTVRRPLFLAGNAFKASEDAAFLQVPYIDVFLEIDGCPEISLTDQVQPLETVARPINVPADGCCATQPFALWGTDILKGSAQLARDFSIGDGGEIPLQLVIVTKGFLLKCDRFDLVTVDEACMYLERTLGIKDLKDQIPPKLRSTSGDE